MSRFAFLLVLLGSVCGLKAQSYIFGTVSWDDDPYQHVLKYQEYKDSAHFLFRRDHFEFFRTNSGRSGETLERHYAFQMGSQKVVDQNKMLICPPIYGGKITTLDYRIWKDGKLIYEPGKRELMDQLVNSKALQYVPTAAPVMRLEGAEPGCVVEVVYGLEGVHLPEYVKLNDRYSIGESILEVSFRKNRELIYHHSPIVEVEDSMGRARHSYRFTAKGLGPEPQFRGMDVRMGINPFVELDWRHVMDYYKGEVHKDWFDYVNSTFYKGDIYDYGEYENFDNLSFGLRIYWSSQMQLVQQFGNEHLWEYLMNVRSFATTGAQDGVMDNVKDLERYVDSLAQDTSLSIVEGVMQLNLGVNDFVINQFQYLLAPPMDFMHYSLLSKFYYDYFEKRNYPVMPMMLKVKRMGPFAEDFISTKQFGAMAMGFLDQEGKFHFTMLGPYLGNFYEVDHFPSDFSGGQAAIFDLEKKTTHALTLPYNPPAQDGFKKVVSMDLDFAAKTVNRRESYELFGAFRNKMYHAYLLEPDSAHDAVTASERVKRNNGVFNKSAFSRVDESSKWKFFRHLELKLSDAQILRSTFTVFRGAAKEEAPVFYTALPLPYEAEFRFDINSTTPFDLEVELLDPFLSKVVDVTFEKKQISETQYYLKMVFTFKEHLIGYRDIKDYNRALEIIRSGIAVKVKEKE